MEDVLEESITSEEDFDEKFGNVSSKFFAARKPESTEGGRLVSILKWPEGAPLNLG